MFTSNKASSPLVQKPEALMSALASSVTMISCLWLEIALLLLALMGVQWPHHDRPPSALPQKITDLIVSNTGQTTSRTHHGMVSIEISPNTQVKGAPDTGQPYLKDNASKKSCFVYQKPCFFRGKTVGQDDAPFSWPSSMVRRVSSST